MYVFGLVLPIILLKLKILSVVSPAAELYSILLMSVLVKIAQMRS